MADRCGVSADPSAPSGAGCDRSGADAGGARRLRGAARARPPRRRVPVLLGTGHPHRLLGFYAALADALSAAGCTVLTPAQGRCVDITTRFGRTHAQPRLRTRCRAGAGTRRAGAPGVRPARTRTRRSRFGPLWRPPRRPAGRCPELVIGDHGWVCGAGQLGFEAIGLADTDDPALFVGEAEGRVSVAVPLDDAVRSDYYRPLTRYVLNRACLSQ